MATDVRAARRIRLELPVSAEQLVPALLVLSALLCAFSLALGIAIVADWLEPSARVVGLFYADVEKSVVAWFESGLLLFCSLLALGIASRASGYVPAWIGLAVVFAAMSADEIIALHESIGDRVHRALDTGGPLLFAFVIPGTILLAIGIVVFMPLVRSLEQRVQRLFVLATCLFFGAVLGLEVVGGALSDSVGSRSFAYVVVANVEEFMELAGVSVFILALAVRLGSDPMEPREVSASR